MDSTDTTKAPVLSRAHTANRISIDVGQPFEDFRRRYEEAVPLIDLARLNAMIESGATWDVLVADVNAAAPYGLLIYWKWDVSPIVKAAGHAGQCYEYLMGNHAIAEGMFRHDLDVLLYAPLRIEIFTDRDGSTQFTIDQPSTLFGSFSNQSIADVGVELDRKVATLLNALGVQIPDGVFRSESRASSGK